MRILIALTIVLLVRGFAADVPVGEDVIGSIVVKMLAESPVAGALIFAAYLLRPVLKMYLDQQIEQLKLITKALEGFGERLGRVEKKVDELVEVEHGDRR
jgi:hypothetical protein